LKNIGKKHKANMKYFSSITETTQWTVIIQNTMQWNQNKRHTHPPPQDATDTV